MTQPGRPPEGSGSACDLQRAALQHVQHHARARFQISWLGTSPSRKQVFDPIPPAIICVHPSFLVLSGRLSKVSFHARATFHLSVVKREIKTTGIRQSSKSVFSNLMCAFHPASLFRDRLDFLLRYVCSKKLQLLTAHTNFAYFSSRHR